MHRLRELHPLLSLWCSQIQSDNEESRKVQLLLQRIDAGKEPACVLACPTSALDLIDLGAFQETDTVQYVSGSLALPS